MAAFASATVTRYQASLCSPHNALHSPSTYRENRSFHVYVGLAQARPNYRTYVGVCVAPFFFSFGVRCTQYKVHAQCSFAVLAQHMPCMFLVYRKSQMYRPCGASLRSPQLLLLLVLMQGHRWGRASRAG